MSDQAQTIVRLDRAMHDAIAESRRYREALEEILELAWTSDGMPRALRWPEYKACRYAQDALRLADVDALRLVETRRLASSREQK